MADYKPEQPESSSKTQRAAILRVLGTAAGEWVPLLQILELRISQYGARIHELRRLGHRIENKSEWRNGKRRSWFRLDSKPAALVVPEQREASGLATAGSFPEFGSLVPEAGYPD